MDLRNDKSYFIKNRNMLQKKYHRKKRTKKIRTVTFEDENISATL